MSKKGPKGSTHFQPLTQIRQIGTKRDPDGTIYYSFAAEVNRDLPAVRLVLTITPALILSIEATFDEQARADLHLEETRPTQPHLLEAM